MAVRSRVWVCCHSLAEIVGVNPVGHNGCLSLLSVVCQVEVTVMGW